MYNVQRRKRLTTYDSEIQATKWAWKQPFKGEAASHFCQVLDAMNLERKNDHYANTIEIVQSSGTGKSRMVDEAGKMKFTIPVNLRPGGDDSGFPRADHAVRDWFTMRTDDTSMQTEIRFIAFLQFLFEAVEKEIRIIPQKAGSNETLPQRWYNYFQSSKREELYDRVVAATNAECKVRYTEVEKQKEAIQGARGSLTRLIDAITSAYTAKEQRGNESYETKLKPVVVVLYFDESYALTTDDKQGRSYETAYQILCKAISVLYMQDLFAVFLSTGSDLSGFSPSKQSPFVELPFDTWKEKIIIRENTEKLTEVCKTEFMARFGRPLFWTRWENGDEIVKHDLVNFAMAKLSRNPLTDNFWVGQMSESVLSDANLAVLATRLHISFEHTRWSAIAAENRLVQAHMRIVFSVPAHREYMHTGTPSEPLLAEAAARLMQKIENIPRMLSGFMDIGLVGKGERGELVARLLLTLAHDVAVLATVNRRVDILKQPFSVPVKVIDFFTAMLGDKHAKILFESHSDNTSNSLTFRDAFKDAYIHFTHFGQGNESIVSDEAAWAAMARGMGWQCIDQQYGIDIIVPILMRDACLGRYVMSAILVQIIHRQDETCVQIDADRDELRFFTPDAEGPYASQMRPYVALVMELGVQATTKARGGSAESPAKFETGLGRRGRSAANGQLVHPRYSIHIVGCSSVVYAVIKPKDNPIYSQLLGTRPFTMDHPRQDDFSQEAIRRMKPFWDAGPHSFGWGAGTPGKSSICNPTVADVSSPAVEKVEVGIYNVEE